MINNIQKGELSDWKIPLYKIYTDDEDVNLITKIVKRGSEWAIGPEIAEFENAIKNYVDADYCIALNSGTSALHATFLAYGLGRGDEIIIPSFTFIATANSVLFVDAKPSFADIEEVTFGLDSKSVHEKITKNTKAVVPVDYSGLPCNITSVKQVAEDNNLILIEDAAEALGSAVNGGKTGSMSHATIFSFCANKIITTGEGGAVVTNSRQIYEKLKLIRSHGRVDNLNYFNNPGESSYTQLGFNWRMSSMTAALGISQLAKIEKIIKMRQENANYLSSRLSKYAEIRVPSQPSNYKHVYQLYTIKLTNEQMRDELHTYLLKKRIFSKVYFNPVHLTSFYREKFGLKEGLLPVTEDVSSKVLSLPIYPNMNLEEKNYLIDSISEFFESNYRSKEN